MMARDYYTDGTAVKLFDDGICEAEGCISPASTAIEVKVGTLGVIMLYLCNHCVNEFEDDI
jgi:hypothetical protein